MAQAAISDAVDRGLGSTENIDFKERVWVPAFTFLIDVAAVETAVLFGYLARYALTPWWPINLTATTYAGLILGVLVVPVSYYLVGLHPGYGLGKIERLRRRVTVTIFVFGGLIVWDNIAQAGDWSRGVMVATFAFALVLTPLFETLGRGYLIRKGRWGVPQTRPSWQEAVSIKRSAKDWSAPRTLPAPAARGQKAAGQQDDRRRGGDKDEVVDRG